MKVWLFCEKLFLFQQNQEPFSLVDFTQSGNILTEITESYERWSGRRVW